MKNLLKPLYVLTFLSVALIACSSSDDNSGADDEMTTGRITRSIC